MKGDKTDPVNETKLSVMRRVQSAEKHAISNPDIHNSDKPNRRGFVTGVLGSFFGGILFGSGKSEAASLSNDKEVTPEQLAATARPYQDVTKVREAVKSTGQELLQVLSKKDFWLNQPFQSLKSRTYHTLMGMSQEEQERWFQQKCMTRLSHPKFQFPVI